MKLQKMKLWDSRLYNFELFKTKLSSIKLRADCLCNYSETDNRLKRETKKWNEFIQNFTSLTVTNI